MEIIEYYSWLWSLSSDAPVDSIEEIETRRNNLLVDKLEMAISRDKKVISTKDKEEFLSSMDLQSSMIYSDDNFFFTADEYGACVWAYGDRTKHNVYFLSRLTTRQISDYIDKRRTQISPLSLYI